MAAKIIEAGGRVFVSEDYVDDVLDLFPDTSVSIGKGWQVNLGKTANDLLLFTDHAPVEGIKGATYLMTCQGGIPYAQEKIGLLREWGDRQGMWSLVAAAAPSGMYGYTKAVQGCCEGAIRKLGRRASRIVRSAARRDERVVGFLQAHAKRNHSKTAKVLLAAYQESLPKLASMRMIAPAELLKMAAVAELGMYGLPSKTVRLGLNACADLHEAAGGIVASLHNRKADQYKSVVGFFGRHAKEAGCLHSRLLAGCYPNCD